jgi:putative pyrroloquinoline-quinone-binding quinoprotein
MMPMVPTTGRRVAAAAILLLLCSAVPASAVSTRIWKQRERTDFEVGDPKGVSLSVEGPIRLGAGLDPIVEPGQPYIWTIAVGPRGDIYAAGGNDGVIRRVDPGGHSSAFLHVDEAEVHALAVDTQGSIYAGTGPGGRLYKFSPDGKRIWDRDTGEKYIWALAFDKQGRLYAGTGTDGRVLAVDASGSSRVLFDSAETHIRSLATDDKGGILAGSDGHGLIFRIDAEGKSSVLYDAPLTEVVAIQPAPDGTIYAAVAGEAGRGSRPSPPTTRPAGEGTSPEAPREGTAPASSTDTQAQGAPAEQRISIGIEGKVLAIAPDGYAREVWSAAQEGILSLVLRRDGALLMGSGSQGRIYALERGGGVSEVARSASSQVTALARRTGSGHDEEIVVGGSNLGSVSILRAGFAPSGSFESRVFDAQSFATWSRIAWKADLPAGTSIGLQVRTGNTEDPDRTWSDWSREVTNAEGSVLDRPAARFVQWRALLKTGQKARSPELREVSVIYMQRNLPPEFRKIEVLAPGVSLQAVPPSAGSGPSDSKTTSTEAESGVRRRPKPQSRRGVDPGARSVQWQAVDPNEDDLQYDVQYRAIDEKNWKTLKSRIAEDFVTFDAGALPDGSYLVRVIASDAPSNPADQALSSEKITVPFDVDNNGPRIERLKGDLGKGRLTVSFSAADGFSVLRDAWWSLDAADWVPTRPVDGMSDAPAEQYEIDMPAPATGEHSVVVRVTDSAGNIGSGRVVVDVP